MAGELSRRDGLSGHTGRVPTTLVTLLVREAMMRTRCLQLLAMACILGGFAGCTANGGHAGIVAPPQVGKPYLEFTYLDTRKRPHRLGDRLGDFTLLMFSRCEDDTHGRVAEELEDLVRVSQDAGFATSVGYDIHWSERECPREDQCHLVSVSDDLFSICDARGTVRRLYQVGSEDEIIVIGPSGEIEDRAPLSQFDALKRRFQNRFRDYAAEKERDSPRDF